MSGPTANKPWHESRPWLADLAFILIVSLGAHLAFSWMGFNPTDDGFFLAQSRRILDGQVPHRDFISMRPALTAILHAPVVALGGDYTLWISRYIVWIEFTCIGWCWVAAFRNLLGLKLQTIERLSLALIAFAFSTHIFPLIAWPTVDGMFFISVGLALATKGDSRAKVVGYFLIGLAYLCKQGYAFYAPLSIIAIGDWRKSRHWLAGGMPLVLYGGSLCILGIFDQGLVQYSSASSMFELIAIDSYTHNPGVLCGALLGLIAMLALNGHVPALTGRTAALVQRGLGSTLFAGPLALSLVRLVQGPTGPIAGASMILFGTLFGAMLAAPFAVARPGPWLRAAFLALLAGWCASISLGYNAPALASGPMAIWLVLMLRQAWTQNLPISKNRLASHYPLVGLALVASLSFAFAREEYIYRELPGRRLTYNLGEVLPGAKLIRTNANTYAYLADLNKALELTGGQHHAVVPGIAAWWICNPQPNPMPLDWFHCNEMAAPALRYWLYDAIDAQHGQTVFIVEKLNARPLARRIEPMSALVEAELPGTSRVRENYTKIDETDFFELFE